MNLTAIIRLIIFLTLNFSALAIGRIFTASGVTSDWYMTLDKAPWTPPGWTFGVAWSLIMFLFTVYMTYAWEKINNRKILIVLFTVQWILNVIWNPAFFYYQNVAAGVVIIIALLIVVATFQFSYHKKLSIKSYLITPYLLWLIIASSLNIYIIIAN